MDETTRKKQVRKPPSIPFLWEVKPGIPKKDFTPEVSSVTQLPTVQLKLIASVPFTWEEQPGKPIPNFSPMAVASAPPNPAIGPTDGASSSGYPVACSYSSDDAYKDGSYGDGNGIREVKPGFPKKDFTPEVSAVSLLPTIPTKLIASVPFAWEEQPGKPIPNFSPMSVTSVAPNAKIGLTNVASSSGYPMACSYGSDEESSSDDAYKDGSNGDGNRIWEVEPGVRKKDFTVSLLPTIPTKLIASVPFAWEEQPGKPIPNFSPMSVTSVAPNPEIGLTNVASSSGYPMACSYGNDEESSSDDTHEDGSYGDGNETMSTETFGFETDESYSSAPSLLANCLAPSAKISAAIPQQKTSLSEHSRAQLETPSSPVCETNSSTSSYETGSSSLVGASFLERLFPLLPPNSGFLEKAEYSENRSTPLEQKYKDFGHEDDISVMLRRPPTLGELIMMSQRRSYRRKAIQMRKWDPPMGITTNEAFGCSIFGISSQIIEELKRKYFPRPKMI